MENVEFRSGQERFPDKDPRLNPVFVDQGQTHQQLLVMGEQRGVDPYKLVEVQLTGGAPWGFTLKGGREHGEPLIITKIEEGSKAAAVEKLLAGDEIVSINDVALSGFRQEAICLVKGSHKMLKLIVKRKMNLLVDIVTPEMPSENDVHVARSYLTKILRSSMRKNDLTNRPHSWHATKFTENQPEMATSRLSSTNVSASWHSRYHASSSSHDLSSSWDQSNLHRTSDQFSSAGSMDSLDHTPQTYQYGHMSSAKSNSSIDHLGNPSKRDSAYGSFSTSSSTPDHTLSNVDVTPAENVLYKVSHWDTPKQGNGKTASFLSDNGELDEKSACFSPPLQYENSSKSSQLEDHSDAKYSGTGRSNFGPVWYVPEKKKSPSPPPPPPPLRSDSFAATKGHERAHVPLYSEGIQSTQHFEVLHRPQPRNDWSTEVAEQQKRAARIIKKASDGTQSNNPTYRSDLSLDYSLPCSGDRVNNNVGNANRLHSSLSSTDVRFAQSIYGHHCHHHQRQYSDESTFFHNAKNSALPKEQRHLSSYAGIQERPADKHNLQSSPFRTFSTTAAASDISSEEKMDSTGLSRYYCVAMKQPAQGNLRPLPLKDECWNSGIGAQASARPHESPAVAMMTQSPKYYLPQQPVEPSQDACEKSSCGVGNKGENVRTAVVADSKKFSYPEKSGQTKSFENHSSCNEQEYVQECALMSDNKVAPKDFKWGQEEKHIISPQKTPMLHSLAQEGKNQPDKGAETGRPPVFDAHLSKTARRSDRFATTLRNEIQMRRAKLQKSKSTATLAESTETEDIAENWKPDSAEKVNPSSENYFTNEYKDNLKEAQARVLRATSFQRRDLEPSSTDYFPDQKASNYNSTLLALVSEDESGFHKAMQSSKQSSPAGNHHISRIGGRRRFTAEQKLKSYSEPEKINEVGVSDDDYHSRRRPTTSEEALGSFADRWKFFEETSKPAYQKSSQTNIPNGRPEGQPGSRRRNSHEGEAEGSWYVRRMRAASFGIESTLGAYNRSKDSIINTSHKTKSGQPQRLETFAEYQASWKEQRKPLETRSSGRYHSADNILDAGHEQLEKPQYTHERSRSSPSTDFHKQEVSTAVRRQTENSREAEEHNSSPARPDERSCNSRLADVGYAEGHPGGPAAQQDLGVGVKWKASTKPSHAGQTSVLPQGSRSRSGTLPSDYRYSQENVNENSKDYSVLPPTVSELQITDENNLCQSQEKGEKSLQAELGHLNKKHGLVPQRPPPLKRDNKHRRQDSSSVSVPVSSESLLTANSWLVQSVPPVSSSGVAGHYSPSHTVKLSGKLASTELPEAPQLVSAENVCQHLEETTHLKPETVLSSTYRYLQKPVMEASRSPSPQFAPQKLTDKPPVAVQDENPTRIERVMDNNTMVKMVPIKIVHSESHAEKESRQNLTSTIEPPALPSGLEKDQIKTLSTSEQSYSRFCAYTRQGVESEPEKKNRLPYLQPAEVLGINLKDSDVPAHAVSYVRAKEKTIDDWKSEELAREIVGKDKSLADILDPNVKIRTTMDLMVGIFPKDEHLLEEAQQRRKLLLKVPSPKATEDKKEEQPLPLAIPLTTSSTYYSTSAPKAELLIKMKDMQQQQLQQQCEEDSEDELDHDLSEKKQELIDSISRKLQVLREARETLLEDIQANNLLGDEVEALVKEVCKPNEFDKFRMFIGDLDKVVNLLLSLSGRLARVENALNNLDENASPEERRVLVEKQKLLTQQHEDAKELKENLDRRERIVFDILASYLSDENLADYEHFVKMKSALIIEQRELEDKIKLGEEQLKCLTDSLQPERPK